MAKVDPTTPTVLQPLSNFDLSAHTLSSIKSAALFTSQHQTLIFIGTHSGSLIALSQNHDVTSTSKQVSFLRSVSVSDSPLDAIILVSEIDKVIVLCDGLLFIVDLMLSQVKRLNFAKGVCGICRRVVDNESEFTNLRDFVGGLENSSAKQRFLHKLGGIRTNGVKTKEGIALRSESNNDHVVLFAIVIGKRLLLVELVNGLSLAILKEIQCIDGVKTVVWLNDSIIVGTVSGYSLFSCVTGQSGVIFTLPDVSSLPLLKLLWKEKKVLLLVDNVGILVNEHGQPVRGSLVFRWPADSIGELGSYVVVVKDGKMELYHKRSGACIQTVIIGAEGVGQCVVATADTQNGQIVAMATPSKVPRNRYWGLHPPPAPLEDVVDHGLMAIQRAIFLRKAGVDTAVDERFLSNPPTRAELLELAIKNISRYLEISHEKDLNVSVREGVDTLLMYLYRALNCVDDMERLASSENSCIVEELETLLDDSGHLKALAFLYASKKMTSKALSIWRILARNYSSGLWKDPAAAKDGSTSVLSSREIAATEASQILEESSDQDLVLQHLGWIADIDPVLSVQVLTSEIRDNQLSPDEVIAAIDPKKVEILQRYLQWLIEDQDSNDTQFHTLYALSLAKSAIETFDGETASETSTNGKYVEAKFSDSGRNSIFQSPVRERLQIFLLSSDSFDPEEVLDMIEGSELWLEKAILYRKLGEEKLVLQILALKLEDSDAAEQYCAEIGRPDAYMQLLDMYLDPQNGKEPMFKAAVRLLHNHGESLDPLQVLETLSPDMPLQLASDTILRMLRARLHHHRQGQIVHNLSHAIHVDARLARLEERSRLVQINDESLCDSCHARLGTKLFAMYPDDTVVCYKCFRRQGESTSGTGRDFKRDVILKPGWLCTR